MFPRGLVIAMLLLSFGFFSCIKKDKDVTLSQDSIIHIVFETDTTNLNADQQTLIQFKAVISSEAEDAYRTVTFTASNDLGTFQGTVKDDKYMVEADQAGEARAIIKVSSNPGTYFISAQVSGNGKTYKTKDYVITLKPVNQDALIKLEFESDTAHLRADFQSFIKLKASIPANSPAAMRAVTFTTIPNIGDFQGTTDTEDKNTVTANVDGIARATIRVGGNAGVFYIAAQIKDGDKVYKTADIPIRLMAIPSAERIVLLVDNPNPVADGMSLVKISAQIKYTQDKTVILNTSEGTFVGSPTPTRAELNIDDQGLATTFFKISNEAITHQVTASVSQGAPVVLNIQPKISYTDNILIEPTGLRIDTTGGNIQLAVTLLKNHPQALVSKNTLVHFKAYQVVNNRQVIVGRFTGHTTPATGADGTAPQMTATFFADSGGILPELPIYIEVSALMNANEFLTEKLTVQVRTN